MSRKRTEIGHLQTGGGQQICQPIQRTRRRIVRGRQAFVQPHLARRLIEQHEISECSADVEADAVAILVPCHLFLLVRLLLPVRFCTSSLGRRQQIHGQCR